ncbi:MAG: tRNA lysidine(34) synthetase TilS [Pseudomonadota bacterium]
MLDRPQSKLSPAWQQVAADLSAYDTLLLAVSGGGDSLAMLVGLAALRDSGALDAEIAVVTVDHGLRPESAQEAKRVADVCRLLTVPCEIAALMPPDDRGNKQAWARAARYSALAKSRPLLDDPKRLCTILTAHTADDQAETFLMRAARSTGTEGLAGIRVTTTIEGAPVHRPFLSWSRQELRTVLDGCLWSPAEDPSNDDVTSTRVRFRRWLAQAPTPDGAKPVVAGLADAATLAALESDALEQIAQDHFAELGGAPYGFLYGNADLSGVPVAVGGRIVRLILASVARTKHRSSHNALPFDLARMTDLFGTILMNETGKWVGGSAVIEWSRSPDDVSVELFAYAEAGRTGFPKLVVAPGEDTIWDGRFRVENSSNVPLTVHAWVKGHPMPAIGKAGRCKPLLESLPVAVSEADGRIYTLLPRVDNDTGGIAPIFQAL